MEGTAFLLFNQQAAATSTETSNISCYASVQSKSRPSSPLGITLKGITRPKPLPTFILEPRASPRRRENQHNIFANGALGRDLTSLIHHRNWWCIVAEASFFQMAFVTSSQNSLDMLSHKRFQVKTWTSHYWPVFVVKKECICALSKSAFCSRAII